MNIRANLFRLLLPAIVMLLFTGLLLAEMAGISIEARGASIALLPDAAPPAAVGDAPARILLACNPENSVEMAFANTMAETLHEMHMDCLLFDAFSEPLPDLAAYDTFLYCSQSLLPLENDVGRLFSWVDSGGHFALLMTPVDDSAFRILYRKLGIIEYDTEYQNYSSLKYVSDLLPLWDDSVYNENNTLTDFALSVRLDTKCKVHIMSGGDLEIPLLWERPVGQGRIAVLNTTLMVNRGGRGFAVSVLSALEDMLVYPIINAGMIFIDDFPAPQPEGFNERLKKQFGYSIQGFFRNHWWPDMKQLSWDYKIRYTGVLIETYTDNVTGPLHGPGRRRLPAEILYRRAAALGRRAGPARLQPHAALPRGL